MPRNKEESHVRIIQAAREEFLEYGFREASMRRIGDRCGMTAAAIYRHCVDKADLFDQVVAPSVQAVMDWFDTHIQRNVYAAEVDPNTMWQDNEINLMRSVIYPHMEEYHLLITGSQGTRYEHYLSDLVTIQQKEMLRYMPYLRELGYPVPDIDPKELRLLLSAYTTAMFEPVVHMYTMEEALKSVEIVEKFFMPGWKIIMGF